MFTNTSPQLCSGYQDFADLCPFDIPGHEKFGSAREASLNKKEKCVLELEIDAVRQNCSRFFLLAYASVIPVSSKNAVHYLIKETNAQVVVARA